jgi:hypothetical protein
VRITYREKAQVLDEAALDRAVTRIAHEFVEQAGGVEPVALVGSGPAASPWPTASPRRLRPSKAPSPRWARSISRCTWTTWR